MAGCLLQNIFYELAYVFDIYSCGLKQNEIAADMNDVLGDKAFSQATVYRVLSMGEFQRCMWQFTEGDHRSGRPIETFPNENIQCVRNLIQNDSTS